MTLLIAAGDPLSGTLSGRIAEALPSVHTVTVSTQEDFGRAIESRPFEIVVVTAELLAGVEASRRALLAESEVVLVATDPGAPIRLRADDFVIAPCDARELGEELLYRVATALHRLDRRLFSELPTPALLREAIAQADALSSPENEATVPRPVVEENRPASPGGESQAFDLESFAANYGDSPDIMHEILRIYLDEAPQRLEAMRTGLAELDFTKVAKAAHSLANTSGTLQSDRAVRAARALEKAARSEDHESGRVAAGELQAVVEAILVEVSNVVGDND